MKINKIVKYLILSDIAFFTGWGIVTPIFPIFVLDRIQGGTALVVGIASAVYWIVKAFLEFPIGTLLDRYAGEKDEYLFLVAGLFIASLVPFGYIVAVFPWHIYLLQFFYGLGMAMTISGWRAIFTKHIDKGKEASEWSLDNSLLGFGTGLAGILSGYMVLKLGFSASFVMAGILGLAGVFLTFGIRNEMQVSVKGIHANIMDFFSNGKTKKIRPEIKEALDDTNKK
ncbi:MAG: MFS transporter [Candidatus Pacebacteria bacterium]|nr:MFS transporter [Candidatus Paceibacterota bacterium]